MQHYPARSKGEYFGPWSLTDRSRFAACAWGDAPVQILHFRRELFHHILTPILFRTIASTPAFNRAVKNHRSSRERSLLDEKDRDSIRELLTACDHWNAFPSVVRHNLLNKAEIRATTGAGRKLWAVGDLPCTRIPYYQDPSRKAEKRIEKGKLWEHQLPMGKNETCLARLARIVAYSSDSTSYPLPMLALIADA